MKYQLICPLEILLYDIIRLQKDKYNGALKVGVLSIPNQAIPSLITESCKHMLEIDGDDDAHPR